MISRLRRLPEPARTILVIVVAMIVGGIFGFAGVAMGVPTIFISIALVLTVGIFLGQVYSGDSSRDSN